MPNKPVEVVHSQVVMWSDEGRDATAKWVAEVKSDWLRGLDAKGRVEVARRLAACWNACHGVPTEDLESNAVSNLVAVCRGLVPLTATHYPNAAGELAAALEPFRGEGTTDGK